MMNKMMSSGEAYIIRFNIDQIERNLGYSVPRGLLDYSDLTEILSPGEIENICYNIREVHKIGKPYSYYSRYCIRRASFSEKIIAYALLGIIILIMYALSLILR